MFRPAALGLIPLMVIQLYLQGCGTANTPKPINGSSTGVNSVLDEIAQDACVDKGGDSDGDGICNADEVTIGTNPNSVQTAGHELPDCEDDHSWAYCHKAAILMIASIVAIGELTLKGLYGRWNPLGTTKPPAPKNVVFPEMEVVSSQYAIQRRGTGTDAKQRFVLFVQSQGKGGANITYKNKSIGNQTYVCLRSDFTNESPSTTNVKLQFSDNFRTSLKQKVEIPTDFIEDCLRPNSDAGLYVRFAQVVDGKAIVSVNKAVNPMGIGMEAADAQGKQKARPTLLNFNDVLTASAKLGTYFSTPDGFTDSSQTGIFHMTDFSGSFYRAHVLGNCVGDPICNIQALVGSPFTNSEILGVFPGGQGLVFELDTSTVSNPPPA